MSIEEKDDKVELGAKTLKIPRLDNREIIARLREITSGTTTASRLALDPSAVGAEELEEFEGMAVFDIIELYEVDMIDGLRRTRKITRPDTKKDDTEKEPEVIAKEGLHFAITNPTAGPETPREYTMVWWSKEGSGTEGGYVMNLLTLTQSPSTNILYVSGRAVLPATEGPVIPLYENPEASLEAALLNSLPTKDWYESVREKLKQALIAGKNYAVKEVSE